MYDHGTHSVRPAGSVGNSGALPGPSSSGGAPSRLAPGKRKRTQRPRDWVLESRLRPYANLLDYVFALFTLQYPIHYLILLVSVHFILWFLLAETGLISLLFLVVAIYHLSVWLIDTLAIDIDWKRLIESSKSNQTLVPYLAVKLTYTEQVAELSFLRHQYHAYLTAFAQLRDRDFSQYTFSTVTMCLIASYAGSMISAFWGLYITVMFALLVPCVYLLTRPTTLAATFILPHFEEALKMLTKEYAEQADVDDDDSMDEEWWKTFQDRDSDSEDGEDEDEDEDNERDDGVRDEDEKADEEIEDGEDDEEFDSLDGDEGSYTGYSSMREEGEHTRRSHSHRNRKGRGRNGYDVHRSATTGSRHDSSSDLQSDSRSSPSQKNKFGLKKKKRRKDKDREKEKEKDKYRDKTRDRNDKKGREKLKRREQEKTREKERDKDRGRGREKEKEKGKGKEKGRDKLRRRKYSRSTRQSSSSLSSSVTPTASPSPSPSPSPSISPSPLSLRTTPPTMSSLAMAMALTSTSTSSSSSTAESSSSHSESEEFPLFPAPLEESDSISSSDFTSSD